VRNWDVSFLASWELRVVPAVWPRLLGAVVRHIALCGYEENVALVCEAFVFGDLDDGEKGGISQDGVSFLARVRVHPPLTNDRE
jgi:hypothetical protein